MTKLFSFQSGILSKLDCIYLSSHNIRELMSNVTESCLDCQTPLEVTPAGEKKKACPKCGAFRRKREYQD